MLLVEYRLLDKVKVINEGTGANRKLKVRGKFQKCDEQNNNGRVYPKKILESQVTSLQEKIKDRALVGALDHPPNDAIHLSQASHLITKLWVESNGDVMGEAEILSTPSGKIVEALLNDGVKIGISSRGLGTISEGKNGKIVNEDFKLITFDLVSDPSTKGAFPELTESVKLNSQKAQKIVSEMKKQRILLTALESKINERLEESSSKGKKNRCWKGYKPTPGKKAYSDGSCQKESESKDIDEGSLGLKRVNRLKKSADKQHKKYLNTPGDDSAIKGDERYKARVSTENKDNIHKRAKTAMKSKKTFKFGENTTIQKLTDMIVEGMVKKINKAKKRDWEEKGDPHDHPSVRVKSNRMNRKHSNNALDKSLINKAKRASRGDPSRTHSLSNMHSMRHSRKGADSELNTKRAKNESIELILQRIEEGTATQDDIDLVTQALANIVTR